MTPVATSSKFIRKDEIDSQYQNQTRDLVMIPKGGKVHLVEVRYKKNESTPV